MGFVTFIAFFGAIFAGIATLAGVTTTLSELSNPGNRKWWQPTLKGTERRKAQHEAWQVGFWIVGIFGLITAACVAYLYFRWT